ncbi:hypothetical protein DTO013E5_7417 [Penicillium roqueforti]|uniref:uncharacterized protein n=1 Tax=Penicillium roqueforti TaxID=5082 RepID=UPI00190C99FF|nr:uncharacterized protein LCP9604111_5088 [Penicillium roqueforti]KAF9248849.1 hypothetical protein LCP9604111_5088 [Penicillium roqueforti]KAI1831727.1 hypothetical protein CBS147337_7537 [Penicillium roqueforti]KAI2681594.1 hypothetical protein CBS147355_2804 [Penicillium roqueforti]KAI2688982.1 hypothetical protein LCP963914a_2071 [Penicillium roqueforti]KAI2703959.1 hypothetical protein CBS147372_2428 [Penicillium roqueforti]
MLPVSESQCNVHESMPYAIRSHGGLTERRTWTRSSIFESVWDESNMTMASIPNDECKFVNQNVPDQPRGLLDL